MSWQANTEATATDLARLVVRPDEVRSGDLDAALTARRAVLELAFVVHRDLTGAGARTTTPTLAGLADDPVRTLGQLIYQQPRPHPEVSLAQATSTAPTDAVGALWHRVAEHATLAQHYWSTATPGSWPRDDAAWSVLAHVGVLAHAVNVLDEGVAWAAELAGRESVRDALLAGTRSGLREAALVVGELARTGPLPAVSDLPQPPSRQLVAVVDRFDLAPALSALRHQLSTAAHVAPKPLQLMARASSRALQFGAALTGSAAPFHAGQVSATGSQQGTVDPARLAAALDRHADRLWQVVTTPRRTESVRPSDPVPLAQAQIIMTWLATNDPRPSGATPGRDLALGRAVASAGAETTAALSATAARHHDSGAWLVPAEHAWSSATPYDWIASTPTGQRSPLLRTLEQAAQHSPVLREAAGLSEHARTGRAPNAATAAAQGLGGTSELAAALAARQDGTRPISPAAAISATRSNSTRPSVSR